MSLACYNLESLLLGFPMSSMTPLNPGVDYDYTLDDKYSREQGRIYLSGVQALVRLPLMQQMRDRAAQVNSAGFISGYRGSPLGGFDLELWKAKKHLADSNIVFTPGLNEDLGATMVWGTQQTNLFKGAKYDGVFSMLWRCI
jgi:indolepyruvate ferredoxin oxidoreductase